MPSVLPEVAPPARVLTVATSFDVVLYLKYASAAPPGFTLPLSVAPVVVIPLATSVVATGGAG